MVFLVIQPYKYEFAAIRERIRDHASDIRDAVFARELLHAKQFRDGNDPLDAECD